MTLEVITATQKVQAYHLNGGDSIRSQAALFGFGKLDISGRKDEIRYVKESKNRFDVAHDYVDVLVWLMGIGMADLSELDRVMKLAVSATAKQFGKTFEDINALVGATQLDYSKAEIPMAVFFYEFLRKIRDSHL